MTLCALHFETLQIYQQVYFHNTVKEGILVQLLTATNYQ